MIAYYEHKPVFRIHNILVRIRIRITKIGCRSNSFPNGFKTQKFLFIYLRGNIVEINFSVSGLTVLYILIRSDPEHYHKFAKTRCVQTVYGGCLGCDRCRASPGCGSLARRWKSTCPWLEAGKTTSVLKKIKEGGDHAGPPYLSTL